MRSRLLILGAAATAAALLDACGDPTRLKATTPTVADTLSAYALTGSGGLLPVGLETSARHVVFLDNTFDIAFDLDGSNRPVLLPAKLVASNFGIPREVGLLRVTPDTLRFDDILRAPLEPYNFDSALVVNPGESVIVQAQNNTLCLGALARTIYSKLAIDSVDAARRVVFFRMVVDPNCGFRSFLPGIPTG